MAKFLLYDQFRKDHAEIVKTSITSYQDACAVQEFGKPTCSFPRLEIKYSVDGSQTYSESPASDASATCVETDQESSSVLRPKMATM